MENRDRKYDPDVFELRGVYNVSDNDFDLTQFGLFLTNDTLFISFHINDMVERMGRRLMPGDVIELPHLRDELYLLTIEMLLISFMLYKMPQEEVKVFHKLGIHTFGVLK